ncbi:MAG: sorbosone dehydrogenase family protein [Hyphomonadaceae bacterium]|nr:sorbosone dehydrogenase family protein [Hyphomonadaceae bacterium]
MSVRSWIVAALAFALAACGENAPPLPGESGFGPEPTLPGPNPQTFPTVRIAEPDPWREGEAPAPADGFAVTAFARGLDHPRWIYVLPNGDVLVAEAKAPESEAPGNLQSFIGDLLMSRAGATGESADRITLLRDANGDGVAETRTVFLQNLHSPIGMALIGENFYVANADAIVRFPYRAGETSIRAQATHVIDLPAGRNHHWTKNIIASRDGTRLYATVGSNSNIGENGMDEEEGRAAIWEIELATGRSRLFASGLRNPNGLAWEPITGALWTTVNERDMLGDDLVPDYMTSVRDGGFYGWPYSYYGQNVDGRVQPQRPDLVASAIAPDYALGAHTASLGLAFYEASALPSAYWGGAFVGQHGSWNRSEFNGYQVVFVPFLEGRPDGDAQPVLTGFISAEGRAKGRPVGVAVDAGGGVLVADDVGNAVWRLTSAISAAPP